MRFKGDIIITDPCYICKEKEEVGKYPRAKDYFSYDERYDYPAYDLKFKKCNDHEFYLFKVVFCMKGYRTYGDDLGEDIYDFLKQYIDKSVYDMSDGGFIGRVYDEDDTYDKTFYVEYDLFNQEIKRRKYLCNKDCFCFKENNLCEKYDICKRAYELGKQMKE